MVVLFTALIVFNKKKDKRKKAMKESDIGEFCEKLNKYLQTTFGYKKKTARLNPFGCSITTYRQKFDLYFRWYPQCEDWEDHTLVIARIAFIQTIRDHGTHLLQFLYEQAHAYGYEHISIESVNDNLIKFGIAFGFKPVTERNWCISISDLSKALNSIV